MYQFGFWRAIAIILLAISQPATKMIIHDHPTYATTCDKSGEQRLHMVRPLSYDG